MRIIVDAFRRRRDADARQHGFDSLAHRTPTFRQLVIAKRRANLIDTRQNGGLRRNATQAFNVAVSSLTTVGVAFGLAASMNAVLGVFGEADERNRVRRLLVGSDPITSNMLLYVGVSNLARPEQPLYELANPPSNDGRHGPVITVTSYAPVARFEMDREPADEDLKKIASQIAAALTALLNANPTAAP